MVTILPEGFERVPNAKRPGITFDPRLKRFYLSKSLRDSNGLEHGSKIGLAYNYATRQLLIDLEGRSFFIDKRGYVTASQFAERSYGRSTAGLDNIRYVETSDKFGIPNFIIFDEAD